jgi:hypothetical protein
MTRKDYELIAKAINLAVRGAIALDRPLSELRFLAATLAMDLRRDNPRFDEDKFLKACGLGEMINA